MMHSSERAMLAWPSFRGWRGRMLGLPFLAAACSPAVLFGRDVCLAAGVIAILANFIVFVPLTVLALNGGQAMRGDLEAPPLTARAYIGLLLLWTIAVWISAAALNR
jgi:hypothetical protein